MSEEAEKTFRIEEVDGVDAPPRGRVEGIETPTEKLERKKDYLEGFLAQKPQAASPAAPGGDLYEAVIDALKDIYDPEIPVNIYDLGLIYGVADAGDRGDAEVNLVWDPPWGPDKMTDEARLELGML